MPSSENESPGHARQIPRLTEAAIAHPRTTLLLAILAVLLAAPGLLRLQLRTDGHALVPPDDPIVLGDGEIRHHFGIRDPIVVHLTTEHEEGIFHLPFLRRVARLSDALVEIGGVGPEHVMSLATEKRDRVYPGTLKFRPFLDPMPEDEASMERLRSDIEAADILTGTLVSADRRSTMILMGVPPGSARGGAHVDREGLYRRVRALVAEIGEGPGEKIRIVGAPVAESLLGTHLLQDLGLLLPLSLGVVALVVWLACRRVWGVLLGFSEVGACLLFTFGLMGWLGVPVYLSTAVLPVVLTTVGLADEIHIFWHFQALLRGGDADSRRVARKTMAAMARPVLLTSLTTSLGFLSFLTSTIPPIRFFGLFAALGILFCLLWSLTVVPASLGLLPVSASAQIGVSGPSMASRLRRSVAWLLGHRRVAALAFLAASLIAAAGTSRLFVQDSWIDGFAPGSPFRQDTEEVNRAIHGTHLLLAHLEFPEASEEEPEDEAKREQSLRAFLPKEPRQPLSRPEVLDAIGELEAAIRARPEVEEVLGPHSHMLAVAYLWLGRQEEKRVIPRHPRMVERLLDRFDMGRGEHHRRAILDDDRRRAVLTLYLEDANYRQTERLMEEVRALVAEHLGPHGARLSFAGDVAVSQAMIPAIVRTQVTSLLLALGAAFLVLSFLYRSLARASLALFPTAVAVLWVFGLMGWLGIPLGVATSMFCAITLGIGVDYAIHYLEAQRRGGGGTQGVLAAAADAGPAILADTLAIALGFGLLLVSQVPANARLGLLVAVALVSSCLLTLGGLSLLLSRPAREGSLKDDGEQQLHLARPASSA